MPMRPEEHTDFGKLRVLSRSPHPYHRRKSGPQTSRESRPETGDNNYLPSPSPTPSPGDTGDEESTSANRNLARRRPARTPSDSGTEADDEGFSLLKRLPAPPIRPKKGLRGSRTPVLGAASPQITPAYLSDAGRRFSVEFGVASLAADDTGQKDSAEVERRLRIFKSRRNAELKRRGFETILVASIGGVALLGRSVLPALLAGHLSKGHRQPCSSLHTCLTRVLRRALRLFLYHHGVGRAVSCAVALASHEERPVLAAEDLDTNTFEF